MHKALHPRDNVDRLYGGRGLASIKDSIDASIQRLEDYIEKCGGRLNTATTNNTNVTRTIRKTITRKQKWEEKQLYGCFKRLTIDISHEKTWTSIRKGNFKRETESCLIAPQNNTIRTNHIKARIDRTQQNSRCRLCGDGEKAINHMISKYSKLAQKEYKTRHDWAGKMIHWELYKKLQFDNTNKWYMHNLASFLGNMTHKLPWDFDIQTDHLISASLPDLIIINNNNNNKKENSQKCGLCCPIWSQSKIEKMWKEG